MKVLRVKSVNGDASFQNETVEIYDKIERTLDYHLYHSWSSTQKETNHLGTDHIKFTRTEFIKYYSSDKVFRWQRLYTYYYASVVIDTINNGNQSTFNYYIDKISWSRTLNMPVYKKIEFIPKDSGEAKTEEEMKKLDSIVWTYIIKVLDFKIKNNGGSILQAEAYKNRQYNKKVDAIGMVASGISTILGFVKHPYAQIASVGLDVSATALTEYLKEADDASSLIFDYPFKTIIVKDIHRAFLEP
ncbi:hypothetical protein [Capnocytophaga catalasegens]|uniref:Uncharacterized protein n=1 Tax=Capnocytophaga catalasegens TaxID=1004260 RepID=A0AAV5B123_9FLAO|nr:hypothetical protein [Capnocytophaga catalasegens]GIZ16199.1 hypothetical protein RCZ03_21990 [Capnocytophaga catalasegens]GJM51618.1 hypothetical protein RCZ15_25910 [Capnocytophaga catalasegens]GJM54270.1 hypothetical protein RCZ16_25860 [Capnocytophaga catalasegens]